MVSAIIEGLSCVQPVISNGLFIQRSCYGKVEFVQLLKCEFDSTFELPSGHVRCSMRRIARFLLPERNEYISRQSWVQKQA